MSRTTHTQAIVFSLKPLGENNSSVRLITATDGLIFATLYGGPKSRLRPFVSPWNSGTLYLYVNGRTGTRKITDFDVKSYHLSFRSSLYKTYAASLAAELVLQTNCAGNAPGCFPLVSGFLDGLDSVSVEQARTGLLRFLWRYLALLGVRPDAACCASCGKPFPSGASGGIRVSLADGFLCAACASSFHAHDSTMRAVPETVIRYLAAISHCAPAAARAVPIDADTERHVRALLFFLTEQAVGKPLKTLTLSGGIL
ncbi:MAG: DNA repair protein RecO [Treponema sp.]|nr:DNA repair protein RecO [Treponema sp.]